MKDRVYSGSYIYESERWRKGKLGVVLVAPSQDNHGKSLWGDQMAAKMLERVAGLNPQNFTNKCFVYVAGILGDEKLNDLPAGVVILYKHDWTWVVLVTF